MYSITISYCRLQREEKYIMLNEKIKLKYKHWSTKMPEKVNNFFWPNVGIIIRNLKRKTLILNSSRKFSPSFPIPQKDKSHHLINSYFPQVLFCDVVVVVVYGGCGTL
jgi:hypothetical protein